jgi:hypothetical protein
MGITRFRAAPPQSEIKRISTTNQPLGKAFCPASGAFLEERDLIGADLVAQVELTKFWFLIGTTAGASCNQERPAMATSWQQAMTARAGKARGGRGLGQQAMRPASC